MKANEKNVVRLLAASLVGFAFAVSSAFADATAVPFDWFSEPTANEVSTGGLSSATWSATAKGSPLSLREVAWFENDKLNVDVDYSEAAQQSLTFTPAPAAYDGEQVFTASLNFLAAYDSVDDLPPVGDSKAGIALVKHEDGGVCFAFISKLDTIRAWSLSGPVSGAKVDEPIGVRVTRKSDGTLVYEYKNSSAYNPIGAGGTVSEKITSSSFYGSGLVNSFVGQVNVSGVALMDGVLYPTVADAFAVATNNAVIKLLADCTFDPTADNIAKKNVKIDTDGHTFDLGAGASDAAKLKGLKIVKSGEGVIELATAIPFDGSGTEAAPWKLGTNEDLWYFMYGVNAGTYGTNGEHFVQTNNLDFTEEAPWPGIGSEYDENGDKHLGFSGTYDGDGLAITGLKFANNATGNKYRGFFNQIYNATVKNLWVETLGFEDGMSGEYGGAAVVGCMNASVVSNCVAEGELSGTHNCGGVVGRIGVSGKIIDCKNKVAINCSYTKIGGIAVIAQHIAADGEVLIQGCINTKNAELTATAGEGAGKDGVAGIIAYTSCGKDNQLKIVDCVNESSKFEGYTNSTLAQIVGKINANRINGEGRNVILNGEEKIPAVGSVKDATYADGLCFAMEEPLLLQSQTFNKESKPSLVLVSSNDFEVGGTYYVEAPVTSIAFNGLKEVGDFIKFNKTLSPSFSPTVTLAADAAQGLTVIGSTEEEGNVLVYTVGYATYNIGYYMPDKTAFTAWKSGYTAPTTFTAENTVTLPTADDVDSPAFTLTGWTNSLGVAVTTTEGAYSNLVLYANVEAQTYVVRVPAVKGVDCAVTNQSGAVSGSKVGDFWTYEVTYGDKADVYLTPADGYLFEDGTAVKKISYDNITGPVTVPASDIPTPVKAPDLKEWFYGLIETGWPTKTGMKGAWSASAGEIGDIANFTGSAVEISTDDAALVFTPDDKHSFATDTTIIKSTVSYTVMALADLPEDLSGLKAGLTLVATDSAPAYYGIVKKSGEDANEWQKLTVLGDGEDGESVDVVIELKTVDGVAKVRYTVGDKKTEFLDLYVTESKVNDVAYTGDGVVAKLDGIIETVVNEQTITIGEPLPEGIGEVQVTTNGAAVVGEGGVYKVESGADVKIVFLPASGKILIGNTTYNIEGIDQNIVFGEGEYQFPTAENIPTGLRFTAVGGDVKIGMAHCREWGEASPDWKLEWYKVPGSSEWTTFQPTNSFVKITDYEKIYLTNDIVTVSEGETIYFRQHSETPIDTLSFNYGEFMCFTMAANEPGATIEAGGNVMSLLDKTCEKKSLGEYAFIGLFDGCDVLTTAPTLSATNVAKYCYNCMFKGCSSLTNAPALPVKDLTDCNNCYEAMFTGCTSLKTAPELPATNLATGCYWSMFQNCTSLTAVPELPALYANGGAYKGMFWNCTSLTESLDMAATNAAGDGLAMMYYGCTNLTAIKVTFTEWPNVGSIYDWVKNVAPKGTFYCPEGLPAECDDENHSRIPTGWRVVRTTPGVVTLKVPKAPVAGHEHVSYYVSDGSAEAVGKVEGDYNVYDFSVGTNAYVNFVADEGYVLNDDKPNPCVKTMTAATTVLADEFPTAVKAVVVTVPGAENVTNRFYAVSVDGSVTNEVMAGESGYTMPKGWNYLVVYVPDEGYAIRGQTEFFGGPVTESGALDIDPPEAKEIRTITVVDGKDEAISNMTFIVTNLTAGALIEKKVVGNDATYEAVDGDTVKVVFTADAGYTIFDSSVIEYEDIDEDKTIGGANLPLCLETPDYLSFTAVGGDVTISMTDGEEPLMLEWSFDKDASLEDWVEFDAIEGSNVVVAAGDTVYFRRKGADVADKLNCWQFVFETEGTVEADGNVMSLLDRTCVSKTVGKEAFWYLFSMCESLTTAPKLPATNLGMSCYTHMFDGCIALTNAPALPAKNLAEDCYSSMFGACWSLTAAPALPATNLAESCYSGMFSGCESLTDAPALSVTNLAVWCYDEMFEGCRSLTNAPALPATKMADACYERMFAGCASLTDAPKLPATELAVKCYSSMFSDCELLTNAPALPATELAEQCYADMFYHCPALETAPALPAVELTAECYRNMFADCYSLNSVKVGFTNWREDADATTDWLANVAPTGVFLCPPALEIKRDGSHIPEGWLVNPQTFTVAELPDGLTGYTMELVTEGSALVTNGTSYVVSTNDQVKITFTLDEGYDFVGDGSIMATITGAGIVIGEGDYPFPEVYKQDYLSFTARGGDVTIKMEWYPDWGYEDERNQVLLETAPSMNGPWTEFEAGQSNVTVTADATVYFRRKGGETALTLNPTNVAYYSFNMTAGEGVTVEAGGDVMSLLDRSCRSKTVGEYAFWNLFNGCGALTTAPALPATNLAARCYASMFISCQSLANAPALPAKNLAERCYVGMFSECASLAVAPKLPAEKMAAHCYDTMFNRCASLTNAPALPATELAECCYDHMFNFCTSLTNAPALPAKELKKGCYMSMFGDCTSLTTAPTLSVTNLAYECCRDMFGNCTSLTAAPELPVTELAERCYFLMFQNCYSLTEAPALPATNLANNCYSMMFMNCTNLNSVTVGFTNWCEDVNATMAWLENVAPTGIFLCPPALEIKRGDSNIPNGWLVNPQTFTVAELPDGLTGYTMELVTEGSALVTNGTSYVVSTNDQVKITFTAAEGYDFVGDGSITATISGSDIVIGEEPYKFPEVYKQDYLSFTARGGDVTIAMMWNIVEGYEGSRTRVLLETAPSMTGPWTEFEAGRSNVTVTAETTVYFRRKGAETALAFNSTNVAYYSFYMTAANGVTVEAGGNVMSLLDRTCRQTEVGEYAFNGLFMNCQKLTSAPALPATNLAESCYGFMFQGAAITNAPELKAEILKPSCYEQMFARCKLTDAPALSATNLAERCYMGMFQSCSALTNAPAILPATTLAPSCYVGMFANTKLTDAPALPAMELAEHCYEQMFSGCSKLTSAPALPAPVLVKGCYTSMFALCEKIDFMSVGFTDWKTEEEACTAMWLVNVAPTGIFVCPPALEIKRGDSNIPNGWLVNPQTFTVAALPEGVELKPFNLLTEGSAIYTNLFGFTDYAASSNDLIELTFKTQDGYRFISGDDMLEGTVVTAKIDKTGYVIGTDIPFPTATRVYTIKLPQSKQSTINAIYAVTNGTTDISDKGKSSTGMTSYTVVTGTTTTITFTPYVEDANGIPKKCFLRIPEDVTNPMVIAEISEDHVYGYDPHETPYGVEAVDITIPGVSNMTYYVSNTTYATETFYPDDCGVTNVFGIAIAEDTVFVFTPADGFRFKDETEEAKNPITVKKYADYTIQDSEIPLVVRDMNTLKLAVITGLDYVVTNADDEVEGKLNGDYMEYLISRDDDKADIYFILKDGYTVDGDFTNPLSTNITEDVVIIGAGAPGMPKVVYWYNVQYTNGSETNQTDTVNQDAEYHISTNIYPKTGYTFLGWTNTEAEVALYVTNQVVVNLTTTPGGMVTLTTVYQPNAYTVKYTDGAGHEAVSNATYDVEFAISENVFEKTGYTFQYWTNETAEVGYMPGDIVSNLTAEADGEVVLTAVWAANEYTVKYTDGAGHEAVSNATYDVEFAISENVFEKTGYHFTGWTNEADNAVYLPGEVVSNLTASGEYELTAIWVPNKYEVKYVANGGVGDDRYTTNTFDVAFTAAGADVFTKQGYTYNSWTNANGDVYIAGGECINLSTGDSVTLYAAWVANGYKLAYEPGAGEGVAITNDCVYDVAFAVSNKVFSRTGYVQAGWTNLVTGIGYEFDQIVSNLTDEVDGVVVLTATWTPNAYTVKYTDGAGNAAVSNATYDVEFAISENVFEKTGYHFTGWTNETDNVGYQPGEIVSNLTDEVDGVYELTAIWVPNKYEVKYVANGGVGDDLYTTNTYDEAFIAAGADVFTKQGYTYNSWTNANGDVYTAGGECINLSTGDSVTLYAAWVANEYNLFYTPGDGEGTTVSNLLVYDQEYVVIDKPDDFVKEHYSFKCWTNATENGALYWPGDMISNLTDVAGADVYFDAVWTANVHTVTMPADVGQMTYVVSNETTGAEIEVTGNEFFASYGDDITIYFTANDGYMLVGDDTTLSFTVEGNKTISELPCVPRIIIGDWSDTVGVTNIEWNATNLVNLINDKDKDKAVWVQFRYNFDDGSPILETLPEGFGFNFVGGEGEGYPATFETTPAAGGELRKVSITGVLNTFCTKKLPVNENYFIGDRLVYEPCQIDSTPDGVDTEIEVTWAFILGGTNTIITVGGTNENDGVVTIKANDIKRDGSVAMLELTDKGQIMTKVPTNLIVAARGYTLSISESPDSDGYYTYKAEKCGVVVYTTDVFGDLGDPIEMKIMDWDMPEDLLGEVKAWTSANPDKLATLVFNNDVIFSDGTVIPAGSEIWVIDNEWDVLTSEEEDAILTRDVQPGEAVYVYGNVAFTGNLLVGSTNDCYDTSITFWGDVSIDPAVEVGKTNGVAETYAKAVMYLYGTVAFDESAETKFTLHKNGMVISAAQLGTEIIACDDGCSSFELNDEYHGVWIYACRLSDAKLDVKPGEPFTVGDVEDEVAAAKIAADCMVISPDTEANEWLIASGMWVEYQKLFDLSAVSTGTPNEFQFTAQLKSSVSNEIAVALNAASAKIPDCLKVKTVMVETKPGVLYAVFSSETADGTYTRDDAWVIGTGKEVPVKFKVEGEARFYKVNAAFKRGDD